LSSAVRGAVAGIRLAGSSCMRRFSVLFLSSWALLAGIAACSSSDDDGAATPESFCDRWARAACSAEVVSACQAADEDACRESEAAFCLDALPSEGFSGARADECIDAAQAAYDDADITADEIFTVLRFA